MCSRLGKCTFLRFISSPFYVSGLLSLHPESQRGRQDGARAPGLSSALRRKPVGGRGAPPHPGSRPLQRAPVAPHHDQESGELILILLRVKSI